MEDLIPDLDREAFESEKEALARQLYWVEVWGHLYRLMVLLEKI